MLKRSQPFSRVLAGASLFALFTLPSFAVLEYNATAYNLVDADGKVTAQLTSSQEGTPAIFFYDKDHLVRLTAGVFQSGEPAISLMNKDGKVAATLELSNDDSPSLIFKQDGEDKKVISLQSDESVSQQDNNKSSQPAEIITTKIKTEVERRREYLIYALAFCFGLVGAYFGGRIAVRRDNRVVKAIEEAHKKQAAGEYSPLATGGVKPSDLKKVQADTPGAIIIPPTH